MAEKKTKMRAALVSANSEDANKLKQQFPDLYLSHGRNVMEVQRNAGSNKFDAVLFLDAPDLAKEFFAYHNFLRQKKEFAQTPIALITKAPLVLPRVVSDPSVRTFVAADNLFMPLLNFFNSIQSAGSFNELVSQEKIEQSFVSALGQKLGKDTAFTSRAATDDEAHETFICQLSDEVSTNLLWLKFSARVLERSSEGLKKIFGGDSDKDLQEYIENLLTLTFNEFKVGLNIALDESGAVRFANSENLDGKERVPFVKKAKSMPLIFESNVCAILLETIRYI
jgi:hypothetical protein